MLGTIIVLLFLGPQSQTLLTFVTVSWPQSFALIHLCQAVARVVVASPQQLELCGLVIEPMKYL